MNHDAVFTGHIAISLRFRRSDLRILNVACRFVLRASAGAVRVEVLFVGADAFPRHRPLIEIARFLANLLAKAIGFTHRLVRTAAVILVCAHLALGLEAALTELAIEFAGINVPVDAIDLILCRADLRFRLIDTILASAGLRLNIGERITDRTCESRLCNDQGAEDKDTIQSFHKHSIPVVSHRVTHDQTPE